MEIEKWFNSEVLPKFDGQDIEYMRAYHILPKLGDALKVALEVANYAYKRGFSAFIGHDKSLALKRRNNRKDRLGGLSCVRSFCICQLDALTTLIPYCGIYSSTVISSKPSAWVCAINILSKGSLCISGRLPACFA